MKAFYSAWCVGPGGLELGIRALTLALGVALMRSAAGMLAALMLLLRHFSA